MSRTLKNIAIVLGSLVFIGFLLFVALVVYVVIGENKAHEQADALCRAAAVGSPSAGLVERAISLGASARSTQWRQTEEHEQELIAVFPGALPLSGQICTVFARDGRVESATRSQVD